MRDELLVLYFENKVETFSWRDDGTVEREYDVPEAGPVASCWVILSPREAILHIGRLLREGWTVKLEEAAEALEKEAK